MRKTEGGFTLVELVVAITILLVSLLTISASTLRSHTLRRQNRERVMAHSAIRAWSEAIHSRSIQASDSDPATWSQAILASYGPGATVTFDVDELDRANPVIAVGSIRVITNETLTDQELGVAVGMPRDLNGDNVVSETDVSVGARLLPVIVSVEWTGVSGVQTLESAFYVMGY